MALMRQERSLFVVSHWALLGVSASASESNQSDQPLLLTICFIYLLHVNIEDLVFAHIVKHSLNNNLLVQIYCIFLGQIFI